MPLARCPATQRNQPYTNFRELGLQLRNKTPRRRVKPKLHAVRRAATEPNETWTMNFVHEQSAAGWKIQILTVLDTFTRVSPVIDPRFSNRAENVIEALDRACVSSGHPRTIRVDQGSKFISRNLDLWTYARAVTLDFSRPSKPTDDAFIEAFNRRFRADCLNENWFLTLADAQEKMKTWRRYYRFGHMAPRARKRRSHA
jgi:putative transposase